MPARRIEPEWLDEASDADAAANLADLRRINRWLGGHRTIRSALRGMEQARILDVGAASGEIAQVLPYASVVSLDRSPRNLKGAPKPAVLADAFHLPFPDAAFEVVACSLFLHHFECGEIVSLLREFRRVASTRVAVIDLERHQLAQRFLPVTRHIFGWSPVTVHDGPVSVRAGFLPEELRALATTAGYQSPQVKRHLPWFRLSLVETK